MSPACRCRKKERGKARFKRFPFRLMEGGGKKKMIMIKRERAKRKENLKEQFSFFQPHP